jgi:hypothetical protein
VAFLALASWAVSGAVLFGPFSAHRGTPMPPRTVVDGKLPIPRYSRLVGVPALVRLVRVGSETPRHWDCSGETCRRVALSDVLPGCSHLQAVNVLTPAVSLCQTFTYAMPAPCAVPRTAPIAIAPKPPRFPPSRQSSIHLDSFRSGFDSPDSDSVSGFSPTPCEACLNRRTDCVMGDDEESCVSCLVAGTECSSADSLPPRKRRLNGDLEASSSKRR